VENKYNPLVKRAIIRPDTVPEGFVLEPESTNFDPQTLRLHVVTDLYAKDFANEGNIFILVVLF
jgi:hypothetical protein